MNRSRGIWRNFLTVISLAAIMLATYKPVVALPAIQTTSPASSVLVQDNFNSDSGLWEFLGSAKRAEGGYVQLTDGGTSEAGIAWLKQSIAPPYTAKFKMRIQGGDIADGMVFMFNKRPYRLPLGNITGGALGFEEGNGYGIEFDTYQNGDIGDPYYYPYYTSNHIALIKDYPTHTTGLPVVPASSITDGYWHDVQIDVRSNGVTMFLDNNFQFNWKGQLDTSYDGIGFSAGTGASTSVQEIDDVSIFRPSVVSIALAADSNAAVYHAGDTIDIDVTFDKDVVLPESASLPSLSLNSGGIATLMDGGIHEHVATFQYTVSETDESGHLNYVDVKSLHGGNLKHADGTPISFILPEPFEPSSLGGNSQVVIDGSDQMDYTVNVTNVLVDPVLFPDRWYTDSDTITIQVKYNSPVQVTGTPLLYLNSGGVAAYVYSNPAGHTLNFNYTPHAGEYAQSLTYTSSAALQLNGGTITNSGGNNIALYLPPPSQISDIPLKVDAQTPAIKSLTIQSTGQELQALYNISVYDLDSAGLSSMQLQFSFQEDVWPESWQPYAPTGIVSDIPNEPEVAVFVRVKDAAGNISEPSNLQITAPRASSGESISFGNEGGISLAPNPAFNSTAVNTISFWLWPSSTDNRTVLNQFSINESDAVFKAVSLQSDESGHMRLVYDFYQTSGLDEELSPTVEIMSAPLAAQVWSHVAIIHSGPTVKLYINGILHATGALSDPPIVIGTNSWSFLSLGGSGSGQFAIHDLKLWQGSFSNEEMAATWKNSLLKTRDGIQLLNYFPFEEGQGYEVVDMVNGQTTDLGLEGEGYAYAWMHSAPLYTTVGEPLNIQLKAYDSYPELVTYNVVNKPDYVSVEFIPGSNGAYIVTSQKQGLQSIEFTASNGILTSESVTMNVYVESKPIDLHLNQLSVNGESITLNPLLTNYTKVVSSSSTSANITYAAVDALAKVSVNNAVYGPANGGSTVQLHDGDNAVSIVLTDPDETTSVAYILHILRPEPNFGLVESITLGDKALMVPASGGNTVAFSVYAPSGLTELPLRLAVTNPNASVTVTGATYSFISSTPTVTGAVYQYTVPLAETTLRIHVAAPGLSDVDYTLDLHPTVTTNQTAYALYDDATNALTVRFRSAVSASVDKSKIRLTGFTQTVTDVTYRTAAGGVQEIRIQLSPNSPMVLSAMTVMGAKSVSFLPGAISDIGGQPLSQLLIPVVTVSETLTKLGSIGSDGLHLDDIVRFARNGSDLTGGSDGFDRNDLQMLLGMIGAVHLIH